MRLNLLDTKIKFLAAAAAVLPFVLASPPALYSEVKVTPVGSISALGGKYYLDSEAASFNGRFDAFLSPALKLGENSDLIPVYSGNYSGTQDIQELAGGGVLTRQRQTHTFSLKYVYTDEFDKYKPRASYSKAGIKETKDEKWGKGLFDYTTLSFGFEAEQERPRGTFTESYDFYQVAYPNFSTLLSRSQSVFNDTDTFNQLSQNAGTDTMDNTSHRLALGYTWFPDPLVMQAGYDVTYRLYGDQALAANPAVGQSPFKSDKRADVIQNLNFRATRTLRPLQLSAAARVAYLASNQASYDSSAFKYMSDYYSYVEFGFAPAVNFVFKNGAQFGLTLDWSRLYYLGRLKQDEGGNYFPSKINQTVWLSSLSVRLPVYKKLFTRAVYNYQLSSSNMRYEANYRYNYRANTYLAGLEWEF
ncbi:MAG: hypothetical protein NTY45_07720 [Elusimicrobia bacterium]|nr:hypothetical protein [Elusimicrobiota bacterium]